MKLSSVFAGAALLMAFALVTAVKVLGANEVTTSADQARSAKIFLEMAPVLQSPRCMNCHTSTNFPRQGDDRHRHIMTVARGPDDHGIPALQCQACHRDVNSSETGVPGAPDWHLAPLSMAWEGLSVSELCRLMSDSSRTGVGSQQFVSHLETDQVQWAWAPGNDISGQARKPPPVGRGEFLALATEWIASGAFCPD
jgi:hypothetical protein